MAKATEAAKPQYPFLQPDDPVCLIIKATLKPVGDTDRFQPAGFPEVGHVIYDAPRTDKDGKPFTEKVCIVDSAASMANHLETVCLAGANSLDLHDDLSNLPHVICVTDRDFETEGENLAVKKDTPHDCSVVSTFTEGHRIASDYFLDGLIGEKWIEATKKKKKAKDGSEKESEVAAHWEGTAFRDTLRQEFGLVEVKKDSTYFIPAAKWWEIYKTIFKYDPNSLVHGVMFAIEQIKLSRLLTGHLEAFGARRVGRSGVKFDKLKQTKSGQPIFSVDEETAQAIRATFIIDLALLRSYGRHENGLNVAQRKLLIDLSLWKIKQLLTRPFRYRTQCFLGCSAVTIETENGLLPAHSTPSESSENTLLPSIFESIAISDSLNACGFTSDNTTRVYYPADKLKRVGKSDEKSDAQTEGESGEEFDEQEL